MPLSATLHRIARILFVTWLGAGCGGNAFSAAAPSGKDSGPQTADSGAEAGTTDSGAACVDFEATAADLVCEQDQDCTVVRTGQVCQGGCACGDTPVNAGAAARFVSDTATLNLESCPCAFDGEPRCLAGQCTLCGLDITNQPAGCSDSGTPLAKEGGADGGVVDGSVEEAGDRDSGVKTADSGVDAGTTDGGSQCIDFEPAPSDLTCGSDQDCELVRSGAVCIGQCSCGDTPVNTGASARFASDTAPLKLESCPCAFEGEARCLAGQCTLCAAGSTQPAGCADAATTPPATDGGLCVDIDLSTYDQSCVVATDCIVILTGQVCSSECACGGSPVNAAEQARYEEATSGIAFGECACPLEIAPSCVGNTCVLPAAMPLSP